ncbi:MAG: NUDIX domain-containing protein [Patescibacteria group bacterium]
MSKEPRRLSDEEYRFTYSRAPRICVDLIVHKENSFLLTKRAIEPFKGLWHFPGGRIFYKESVDEAIARISEAEVGLTVKNKELLGYLEVLEDGKYVHSVSMVFLVQFDSGEIRGSLQAQEVKIFEEIPEDTHPVHEEFLRTHWSYISSRLKNPA